MRIVEGLDVAEHGEPQARCAAVVASLAVNHGWEREVSTLGTGATTATAATVSCALPAARDRKAESRG